MEDLKKDNIFTLYTDVELIEDAVLQFIKGELRNDLNLICNHNEH